MQILIALNYVSIVQIQNIITFYTFKSIVYLINISYSLKNSFTSKINTINIIWKYLKYFSIHTLKTHLLKINQTSNLIHKFNHYSIIIFKINNTINYSNINKLISFQIYTFINNILSIINKSYPNQFIFTYFQFC